LSDHPAPERNERLIAAFRKFNGGVVSLADYTPPVAAGGLVTIFGRNLGTDRIRRRPPLPTYAGRNLRNTQQPADPAAVPRFIDQINAQIPVGLAAGRYPLVIHSIANQIASCFGHA
jgi:hypothetical protein